MRRSAVRIAKAGTSPLPESSLKSSSGRRTGNVDALLLWICGIVESRLGTASVVVWRLHILHKTKEREKYYDERIRKSLHNSTVHNTFFLFHRKAKRQQRGSIGAKAGSSARQQRQVRQRCSGILIFHSPDRCERPPDVRGH